MGQVEELLELPPELAESSLEEPKLCMVRAPKVKEMAFRTSVLFISLHFSMFQAPFLPGAWPFSRPGSCTEARLLEAIASGCSSKARKRLRCRRAAHSDEYHKKEDEWMER